MVTKAKLARIEANLRQIDVARLAGMSASLVCLYERGDLIPPPDRARRLNEALKVQIYSIESGKAGDD